MLVIVSRNSKTCHKPECMYAQDIQKENRIKMSLKKAENIGCKKCKYCLGLGELVTSFEPKFKSWEEKYNMKITFIEKDRIVYIQTKIGFWKIYLNYGLNQLQLFHLNEFSDEMSFEELKSGEFHRQSDVKVTNSLEKLVNYISEHDRAKVIIEEDYKKLPKNTKKRKRYYKIAKKKEKWKEVQRLEELFELIKS